MIWILIIKVKNVGRKSRSWSGKNKKNNKNTQPTKIRGLRSKGNIKYGILRKSSFGQLKNLNVKSRYIFFYLNLCSIFTRAYRHFSILFSKNHYFTVCTSNSWAHTKWSFSLAGAMFSAHAVIMWGELMIHIVLGKAEGELQHGRRFAGPSPLSVALVWSCARVCARAERGHSMIRPAHACLEAMWHKGSILTDWGWVGGCCKDVRAKKNCRKKKITRFPLVLYEYYYLCKQ